MREFTEQIRQAESIAVTGHIHPDGDCIGSCLALRQYIKDNDPSKSVDVYLESVAPEFSFLCGAEDVLTESTEKVYDLFFVLDCGSEDRFEPFAKMAANAKTLFCIDHHISNQGLGDFCKVDAKASATCEVLCDLFDMEKISKDCASCLYTGIVHDTGVFKHSNTTKRTMNYAGELLEKGVNSSEIIDETFYRKTYIQNLTLGQALMNSTLYGDGKVIWSDLSADELNKIGASQADTNGVIDQLRVTEGVETAVFTYPTAEGSYKISMRSNDKVNVSEIARQHGGGGHIRAAGCTMTGKISNIRRQIISEILKQI
jgi:phosphoesterase RecJ-like protein